MNLSWLDGSLWQYLSLPVISAVVGYITNVVALRMMFYPIEFRGPKPPYIGWQGIVPRKASKMTGVAVDTLTDSLIDPQEIFARIDARELAVVLDGPMRRNTDEIAEAVMRRRHPRLWASLPEAARRQLKHRMHARAPHIVAAVTHEMQAHLPHLLDLDGMIVRALVRDKTLLNQIFLETGRAEFRFIRRSGAWFGLLFGLVQMGVWIIWHAWWLLPLFGLWVGWATNWLALKMIFSPRRPRRFGPWRIQGLFFRRQQQVATDYGRLVSERILTADALLDELLTGPRADKVRAILCHEIDRAIDEALAVLRPWMGWAFDDAEYARIKAEAEQEALRRTPAMVANAVPYFERQLDVRQTLTERLGELSPAQFEAMLRPAFEEDEWILVAVGAALGFLVGWFQLVYIFGEVFVERFGHLL